MFGVSGGALGVTPLEQDPAWRGGTLVRDIGTLTGDTRQPGGVVECAVHSEAVCTVHSEVLFTVHR